MSNKSWSYAELEAVKQNAGKRDLVIVGALGRAAYPGLPEIDLLKDLGENRVMNYTAIDEMWYTNVALGSALAGAKTIYWHGMYMADAYPFHFVGQHAGKLHHMTGGQATIPAIYVLSISGQSPGMAGQHSDYEEDSWYMHIPGVRTVIPSTVYDVKGLMSAAMKGDDPVVMFKYSAFAAQQDDVPDTPYEVAFGKAAIRTQGSDLTIISSGGGMLGATAATDILTKAGVKVELIDLRSLNPMDTETIVKSVQKTKRLVTFDQSKYTLCPGAEVLARVTEGVESFKARRIAYPDAPPAGAPEMFNWARPTEQNLVEAAKRLLG